MTDQTPENSSSLSDVVDELGAEDPRVSDEYVRIVDSDRHAPVVVVGVVHDHPASIHRVDSLVDALDPAVLGLELPQVVTPLFEQYARHEPHRNAGGEMSAAIRAADDDTHVVGLDMPDLRSLLRLGRTLWHERVSTRTARSVVDDVWRLSRHALAGRLIATGLPMTVVGTEVDRRQEYEVSHDDPPAVQADHEHSHVRRSRALMESFEVPSATRLIDDTRERHIGERLATLRTDPAASTGPIVAVVGYNHLDRVVVALQDAA